MRMGDIYKHYKGKEYWFEGIALPLNERKGPLKYHTARYHEDTHDLDLYMENGIAFIDADVPHVIYQSEDDFDTQKVYAREVDDFYGYVNITGSHYKKRFTLT